MTSAPLESMFGIPTELTLPVENHGFAVPRQLWTLPCKSRRIKHSPGLVAVTLPSLSSPLPLSNSIVGTAFKKSYYSAEKGYNESDLVLAKDLVRNYWAKSVETCPVKTHIIPMDRNKMHSRILEGTFCDVRDCEWYKADAPQPAVTTESAESDNRAGVNPPQPDDRTPFICLEQHCALDLDGDGYAEPYIVTIEESSHTFLRIVCRFDRE